MSNNLHTASNQWAVRPSDERFWTLADMQVRADYIREHAIQADISLPDCTVEPAGEGLALLDQDGRPAELGHYAFGQLAARIGAPAGYLRKLPVDLVSQVVNHGLKQAEPEKHQSLLSQNGHVTVRALTGQAYTRLWNSWIVERLTEITDSGWRTAPARPSGAGGETRIATEADCLVNRMPGLGIQPGDMIGPAGLYLSEKDMFAFMVNENRPIDDGAGSQLFRGFFLENSEVGDRSFKLTTFLYNAVCGNHIVWGAHDVKELRVKHVGEVLNRARQGVLIELRRYADESAADTEQMIVKARHKIIGRSMEDVVADLFAKKIAPQATLEAAFALAKKHPEDSGDASPKSVWGMAQGLTRLSQQSSHTDQRVMIDRAAGKVLEIVS